MMQVSIFFESEWLDMWFSYHRYCCENKNELSFVRNVRVEALIQGIFSLGGP